MMAHEDNDSLKSSQFGEEYKPEALSYDELGDDCQYLILREMDQFEFGKRSRPKARGTLNSLKDLERKKRKLMRALEEGTQSAEQKIIEVIDLTLNSDEENETVALTPRAHQMQEPKRKEVEEKQELKMEKLEEEKIPTIQKRKQIQVQGKPKPLKQISPNLPFEKKKFLKPCEVPDFFEAESDASEKYIIHSQRRRKHRRVGIEYKSDSSNSYDAKYRRRREREKIKEATDRKRKQNSESPPKRLYDKSTSTKAFHDVEEAFGDFRCRVCDIKVNSEATLQTHLVGRKHLKNLMAQAIPEVAQQSLEQYSGKLSSSIPYDQDRNQPLRYRLSSPNMTRVRVNRIAKLQTVAESYRKLPVLGLNYVTEIHLSREVSYYCKLCDSSCAANTIMCHLIGFKHRLNFFQVKFPKMYERFEYQPKRNFEREMMKILIDYDKAHGRGLIKVEKEIDDIRVRKRRRSYSPHRGSCRCTSCYSEVQAVGYNHRRKYRADSFVPDDLDTSMNDFHCTLCDSHMNNEQMWEAHVRGKRHLKNKKKGPSEKVSKIKNIHCPGERAKLMNELIDIREPVVGLNYMQEVQGRAGNQYKCFLCGACCTSFDVIEHIVSEKHRMKLLETEHKKGKHNNIEIILNLSLGFSQSSREKLVEQEAEKFQREYGKGKMLVYKSKDIYPDHFPLFDPRDC